MVVEDLKDKDPKWFVYINNDNYKLIEEALLDNITDRCFHLIREYKSKLIYLCINDLKMTEEIYMSFFPTGTVNDAETLVIWLCPQ